MAFPITNGKSQTGLVLFAILVLLVVMGLSLTGATAIYSEQVRRDNEDELLKIGNMYRIAIGKYYQNSPGIVKQYPRTLNALLYDDRQVVPQRYLRKMYQDPMSKEGGWGTVESSSGGVMGVYSSSVKKPFNRENFPEQYRYMKNKKYYFEWLFVYVPQ